MATTALSSAPLPNASSPRRGLERVCRSERDLMRSSRKGDRTTRKGISDSNHNRTKTTRPSITTKSSSSGRNKPSNNDGSEKPRRRRTCSSSPRRRSFEKSTSSASSATKDLLHNAKQHSSESQLNLSLSSLTQDIKMASAVHYSRRDYSSKRRGGNLNNSRSGGTSRQSLSSSSGRPSCRRMGSRTSSARLSSKAKDLNKVRVIQFDSTRSDGVSFVDANNVHSSTSKNSYVHQQTLLLQEDITENTDNDSFSFENSFSSGAGAEVDDDELPLIQGFEDGTELVVRHAETVSISPTTGSTALVKGTFRAVSKLLATPRSRRQAIKVDLLDMAMASSHI